MDWAQCIRCGHVSAPARFVGAFGIECERCGCDKPPTSATPAPTPTDAPHKP